MYTRVFYYSFLLLLSACASIPLSENWPVDLPAQKIFIESCQNSSGCSTNAETEKHLVWIKRFYYGSILYPTGWSEMTDIVTSTLDNPNVLENTRDRLDKLGLRIVLEWAKNNNVRLINSQMLSTWAKALAVSAEQDKQIEFITNIENDVEQILLGLLMPEEITSKRYYNGDEDYDDF